MVGEITEREIDEYIAIETPWGFTGSREDARRFIRQRRYLEDTAPMLRPEKEMSVYEDQYGNTRWSDTNDIVTKSLAHGGR